MAYSESLIHRVLLDKCRIMSTHVSVLKPQKMDAVMKPGYKPDARIYSNMLTHYNEMCKGDPGFKWP